MSEIDRLRAAFPESEGWRSMCLIQHDGKEWMAVVYHQAPDGKFSLSITTFDAEPSAAVDACIAARDAMVEGSERTTRAAGLVSPT